MKLVENSQIVKLPVSGSTRQSVLFARLLAAAAGADGEACHALGVAYSTAPCDYRDLIEAHKWFNIGAMHGNESAGWSRADIAQEMTPNEIAEAQRRAREWISAGLRRAA